MGLLPSKPSLNVHGVIQSGGGDPWRHVVYVRCIHNVEANCIAKAVQNKHPPVTRPQKQNQSTRRTHSVNKLPEFREIWTAYSPGISFGVEKCSESSMGPSLRDTAKYDASKATE